MSNGILEIPSGTRSMPNTKMPSSASRKIQKIGSYVDELKELGITHVKYVLVRQTRVVYEFDDNLIIIHMFIGTRRDFRAHLLKRLFSQ